MIPIEKMDDFFNALEKAEQDRAPFRNKLESLKDEFVDYLLQKFSPRTVDKHAWIVEMFIKFICDYTDVQTIEEITRGMVNTEFKQWYNRKVISHETVDDLHTTLKKFFTYLSNEKGIINTTVINALS